MSWIFYISTICVTIGGRTKENFNKGNSCSKQDSNTPDSLKNIFSIPLQQLQSYPPAVKRLAKAVSSVLYYTILYYTILYYTILYYTILYYILFVVLFVYFTYLIIYLFIYLFSYSFTYYFSSLVYIFLHLFTYLFNLLYIWIAYFSINYCRLCLVIFG